MNYSIISRAVFGVLMILSIQCSSQNNKNNFSLQGKIKGLQEGKVFFVNMLSNKLDSATVENERFRYYTTLDKFECTSIVFRDSVGQTYFGTFSIPIEANTKLNFEGDITDIPGWKLSGSQEVNFTMQLRNSVVENERSYFSILRQYEDPKTGEANIPGDKAIYLRGLVQDNNAKVYQFIDEHQHTYSAVLAIIYVLRNTPNESVDPTYKKELNKRLTNAFNSEVSNTALASQLTSILAMNMEVNTDATDFTQLDVDGKNVSLSSFRGKYVLVDFWASWCLPCRYENPNVLRVYEKFKDKNFTVLGVSLDQSKEAWVNAIKKDGLLWSQVSDLQGWKNSVAQLYNIRQIPSNFLVDPQGKIIKTNLRGEDLDRFLSSVLHN